MAKYIAYNSAERIEKKAGEENRVIVCTTEQPVKDEPFEPAVKYLGKELYFSFIRSECSQLGGVGFWKVGERIKKGILVECLFI